MRWWEELIVGEDRVAYEGTHKFQEQPRGRRPILLVVDVTRAFCGEEGKSLVESVKTWPTACGPAAWSAMPHLRRLIDAARANTIPVAYTTALPGADRLFGGTVKGEGGAMGSPMSWRGAQEIPTEIGPHEGELVLAKAKASAFFGTPLVAYLHRLETDCLVVCGTTTSGCVRATVVDGFSLGYPVFLAEEATFDRARLSHGVNLYDMHAKYADVVRVDALVEWFVALGASRADGR